MTALRIYFDGEKTGPHLRRGMQRTSSRVLTAVRGAAAEAAEEIELQTQANVRSAGKFRSERWMPKAIVTEGGGNIKIDVKVGTGLFWVFQRGMTIHGKPLLWIPLSFAVDAQGIRARDYPGLLFRVDRDGKAPLLMTPGPDGAEAKYFGKESVVEPKKFHVVEIVREIARKVKFYYRARMK